LAVFRYRGIEVEQCADSVPDLTRHTRDDHAGVRMAAEYYIPEITGLDDGNNVVDVGGQIDWLGSTFSGPGETG